MELIRCAVREWPVGYPGLGLWALWVLVPSQSPKAEPNLGLDTFELCRGVVLEPSCEIWALEKGSHTFPGVPGWGGKQREQGGSCSRTILPGVLSRGENFCAHKLYSKISSHLYSDVPVHSGIGLALSRGRAFSGTFPSLSPSLPPFFPFLLPSSLIFLRQFSPCLSSAVFYANSDMGYRCTEQIIFPLKSISARRFLHRFSAKPAWAANPVVDQVTSMLKAAFELSQYSSQGQRLNYPLQ